MGTFRWYLHVEVLLLLLDEGSAVEVGLGHHHPLLVFEAVQQDGEAVAVGGVHLEEGVPDVP